MSKIKRKIFAGTLCALVLVVSFSSLGFTSSGEVNDSGSLATVAGDVQEVPTINDYATYLSEHEQAVVQIGEQVTRYPAIAVDGNANLLDLYQDKEQVVQFTEEQQFFTWEIAVDEGGLYNLMLDYFASASKSGIITISVSVNGEVPYEQASHISLPLVWKDNSSEKGTFDIDSSGNDLLPSPEQVLQWSTYALCDSEGLYSEPLLFYLNEGVNEVTVNLLEGATALSSVSACTVSEVVTYRQYAESVPDKDEVPSGYISKWQAEHPSIKSNDSLYAAYDRSSPLTEPIEVMALKRNIIGANWENPGQYLEWEVEVPADGYYRLGFKYRQREQDGLFSLRKLYIDGVLPFEEVASIRFLYGNDFQMMIPGDEDGDYLFYLTKGSHTIRLEVTLGELSQAIRAVDDALEQLQAIQRSIMMVTSVNPDPYRDYMLDQELPNLIPSMERAKNALILAKTSFEETSKQAAASMRNLDELIELLERFIFEPYEIAAGFSNFSSCITSLASFSATIKLQPLELDYFVLMAADAEVPAVKANFFQQFAYEAKMFLGSFVSDYSTTTGLGDSSKSVEVWINSGRDQLYILQELLNKSSLDVSVDLKLVSASLVSCVMADIGPDVALSMARTTVLDLGMRNQLEPLNDYEGFGELQSEYTETAFIPYSFKDNIYAIPETQVFNMMFCRLDVLEELHLSVPKTWDEFLSVAGILQQNNMDVGLSNSLDGTGLFAALLYQNGGSFYNDDLSGVAFTTDVGYKSFKQWTDYYTQYSFPLFSSGYNRFRSGEMPIVIMPYSFYSQLAVAAPEIAGKWAMYSIPGTTKENGTIDCSQGASGGGTIMLKTAVNKEACWEFMKWWSSAPVQAEFGLQLEYVMGVAARYTPANLSAFDLLPWSASEAAAIKEQWKSTIDLPEVPGYYYVSRNLNNAFLEVTVQKGNVREALSYWSKATNKEIEQKLEQYG